MEKIGSTGNAEYDGFYAQMRDSAGEYVSLLSSGKSEPDISSPIHKKVVKRLSHGIGYIMREVSKGTKIPAWRRKGVINGSVMK